MRDGKGFGLQVVEIVRGYIDSVLAPILRRIGDLEAMGPRHGKDGLDADPDVVAAIVIESIGADLVALKDAVAAIEPPPQLPDIPALVSGAVAEAIKQLPTPKVGEPGEKGDPGLPGKNGADGLSVRDFVIDRDGCLIVTMSDGTTRNLGRIVGKDGEPGKAGDNGMDGLGFDDLDCTFDGTRTITIKFTRAGSAKVFSFQVPAMVYRDVWKDGSEYERGDTVTWAGSLWHCNADRTKSKPDAGIGDWTLTVKRGRDGRDGKVLEEKSGPVHLPGRKPRDGGR